MGLALAIWAMACGGAEEVPPPSGRALVAPPLDDRADNRAPTVESVRLSPRDPVPDVPITASAEVDDPDGDAVRVTYVWSVNGREVERGGRPTVSLPGLAKGDRVEVTVLATDGRLEAEPRSARTDVANRLPLLDGVALEVAGQPLDSGSRARPGDRLRATPLARDPDGDDLRFEYTWYVNGNERGEDRELATEGLRRGDRVLVRVVASDGRASSRAVESEQVTLGNAPPRILALPQLETDAGTFRYTFEATDDDGDRNLRFWLERAPEGMTVDPLLGVVTWRPSTSQAGVHPVEIGVRDDHGDGSTFVFDVTVTASGGATPAPQPESAEAPAAPAEL